MAASLDREGEMEQITSQPPGVGTDEADGAGFDSGVLSSTEVLAQSVGNIAPTFGAAVTVSLIFGVSGNGAWLTWLLTTAIFLLVAACIVTFARRHATAGSLYSFVARGLGARAAFVVGASWLAIVFTGPVLVLVLGGYAQAFLGDLGVGEGGDLTRLAIYVIGASGAAYISYRGIRLSTNTLLVFEVISMAVILVLLLIVLAQQGSPFDSVQLSLDGVSASDVLSGVVLAVFAFGGFESAAALGYEARDPHRQIPRAVVGSLLIVGFFFVLNAYSQAYGFREAGESLAESSAPIQQMSEIAGLGTAFKLLVEGGIIVSAWACMLANFNHGSRLLFTLGRDRVLPEVFGRTHPEYKTPHVAVGFFATAWIAVLVLLVLAGADVGQWIGMLGTFQGYLYLSGYVLLCVATPVFLSRVRLSAVRIVVASAVAVTALGIALGDSVVPWPEYPYDIVALAFVAYILAVAAFFALRQRRDADLERRVLENAVGR
jgi:amino acid transporter